MKIKEILNIKNIASFIEGNAKFYYDKLIPLKQHTREQILYRLSICKEDCVKEGKCKDCGCPVNKKVFVTESCNKGKRFPDLMNKKDWNKFKEDNNIE